MQLKEMVLAILNESELLLSDDAVEQIVDQVQCFNRNHFLSQIPPEFLQTIQIPPEPYHPNGGYGSGGIWMVWRNSGGICERKTLFRMKKEADQAGFKDTREQSAT